MTTTNTTAKRNYADSMDDGNNEVANETAKTEDLFCNWCKLQLPDEVLFREHLFSDTHKKLNNAEAELKRINQKCALFIKGYKNGLEKSSLLAYFLKFGKVVWIHYQNYYTFLDYEDPESAEKVINRTHYLGGRKLTIFYRQPKKQFDPPKETITYDFIPLLKDIPDFDNQVQILKQNLQPFVPLQLQKYDQICCDLFNVLKVRFPNCRVYPFGSTITGLGFRDSDIDVHVSGIRTNKEEVTLLYRMRHLVTNSQLFHNTLVIANANTPILKCVHVSTELRCDINIKNMLGVCNSHLINYYLNIHPKLRDLMIVIKFWGKVHGITGTNQLFTNYSMILLLIFFLQHPPFWFPPVVALQRDPQCANFQDGWNGGFRSVPVKTTEVVARMPLQKMLQQFFAFYINFDFKTSVVCPYLGYRIPKEAFKEPEKLDGAYFLYKQYVALNNLGLKVDSDVCIQDPFEHSRNITPRVSYFTLEAFLDMCQYGMCLFQKDESTALYKMLSEVPTNTELPIFRNDTTGKFFIEMRLGLKYLHEKCHTDDEMQSKWFSNVNNFTRTFFRDVLKMAETKDGQDEDSSSGNYRFTAKLNLWEGRRAVAKNNLQKEAGQSLLERELAITEQLCKLSEFDISVRNDIITVDVILEPVCDPVRMSITVKKVSAYKNIFRPFLDFVFMKLPVWYKLYEDEINRLK